MSAIMRKSALYVVLTFCAVSSFAQDRTLWRSAADVRAGVRGSVVGTVVDVDEARRQLQIAADDERYGRITVVTDAVSTQYNGFGGMINGQPEIFTGSRGFSNVRLGDRLEVRGNGRTDAVVAADQVTLLGRTVAADTTGVGSTRPATSISTPSATSTATSDRMGRVEGTIRQVNATDNRVVIETDRRELLTIRTSTTTPVYYQGQTYEVRNLEVGDRILVNPETGTTASDRELRATSIEVTQSVQERGTAPTNRSVASISGRVVSVDRTRDFVRVDTGRGSIVQVDMANAYDEDSRRTHSNDLRAGDDVTISGTYGRGSDASIFVASTVRIGEDTYGDRTRPGTTDRSDDEDVELGDYAVVNLSATVTESLETSPTLVLRDRNGGRTINVWATEDFVVRTRTGTYTTADKLRVGDSLLVKAFRDPDGNLIAQSIRQR